MRVYVMRHADAEPAAGYATDADRPLTAKGKRQADSVGRALAKLGTAPTVIISSPFLRACQTAEVLARAARWKANIEESNSLLPGAEAQRTFKMLASRGGREIAVVGHAPQMEELISLMLVGKTQDIVEMKKASVACVEFGGRPAAGKGTLCWHLTVKAVEALLR